MSLLTLENAISLHVGPFSSSSWFEDQKVIDRTKSTKFTVALKIRNEEEMRLEFLDVSNPKSSKYGKFYSQAQLNEKFGISLQDRLKVIEYFETIPGSKVSGRNELGDFITVEAPIESVENTLKTKLTWHSNEYNPTGKKGLRATSDIFIPNNIHNYISFVSLNSPITHVVPRAVKDKQSQNSVGVTAGNQEALVRFQPICGDGSLNEASPPCSNLGDKDLIPKFNILVSSRYENKTNPYALNTDPYLFDVPGADVYCYNSGTFLTCTGSDGPSCICIVKAAPLPKYTQLVSTVRYTFPNNDTSRSLGDSVLFALTDVATVSFLAELYNLPAGTLAHSGSNQSVAEFYGEYYSNSDLAAFLQLSGLPISSIPEENIYGSANDQNEPGGEAQLDVEYLIGLAPNAPTYFYSIDTLNPYDPINEGFLTYLYLVGNQSYPPLVHSLSYGDVEANIFNASNPGSAEYGFRCDQEFQKMGLRGLSVLFSSGDDGLGNVPIRTNPAFACAQAYPAWPASSPYVTAVGGTQLTDKYLPACGNPYTQVIPGLPLSEQLIFQCTGAKETTASSTIGGIITSGGGFSSVFDRETLAPWQVTQVNAYLNKTGVTPPTSYFNVTGRAYPDVATYASNYFVYLDGEVTRESGTSASGLLSLILSVNDSKHCLLCSDSSSICCICYFMEFNIT